MDYKTLNIERSGSSAWIWMNRPEVHNAFDETLIAELTDAMGSVDGDKATRAIVLAGAGKSFSAGADLDWMKRQGAAPLDWNLDVARRLAALSRAIANCRTPTIARVHGAALGGGMGLAWGGDICVASARAQFATSEVRLGIIPAAIGTYVIRTVANRPVDESVVEDTARRIARLRATPEAAGGLSAFIEKRPPSRTRAT